MTDKVFLVNGSIEKADGIFDQGFFFNEIKDGNTNLNLILGSHPASENDIRKLLKFS